MLKKLSETDYLLSGKSGYARVHTPYEQEAHPQAKNKDSTWKYVCGVILDKEDRIAMLELKDDLKVKQDIKKNKDTGESSFQFYRDAVSDGEAFIEEPVVVDANNNPIPKDVLIGNGSDIVVSFKAVSWGKSGNHKLVLNGVKVMNLVPYIPKPSAPPPKPDLSVFKDDAGEKDLPF